MDGWRCDWSNDFETGPKVASSLGKAALRLYLAMPGWGRRGCRMSERALRRNQMPFTVAKWLFEALEPRLMLSAGSSGATILSFDHPVSGQIVDQADAAPTF